MLLIIYISNLDKKYLKVIFSKDLVKLFSINKKTILQSGVTDTSKISNQGINIFQKNINVLTKGDIVVGSDRNCLFFYSELSPMKKSKKKYTIGGGGRNLSLKKIMLTFSEQKII